MVADAHNLTLFHDAPTGMDYAANIGETTPVSWSAPRAISYDEWIAIGNTLQQVNASLNWWIGDWLNYGERQWGEMYAQAIETTGWDYQRLANAKYVTGRIHSSFRQEKLSWTHHAEVASLEPDEQAAWLNRALVEGWSKRRLREEIKGPALPKLAVSFAQPTEAPFNHQVRTNIAPEDRTAVDEYEQQAEELAGDDEAYSWSEDDEDQPQIASTVHYLEPQEQMHTNGVTKPHVANNSGNNEWYTPVDFIEAARLTLGAIDLDPASSDEANEVVRATAYHTIDDDGLVQEWRGRVWLNPPYSADLVGRFIDKLVHHFRAGDVPEAIILVNNATETQWFQALAQHATAICFPGRRIRFWSTNGGSGSPLQGQAFLYLGDDPQAFCENFDFFGLITLVQHATSEA